MITHRRNHALAAVIMLVGAALAALGAAQSWVSISVAGVHFDLGFDTTIGTDGSVSDVKPAILVISAIIGGCALLLIATRVRFLGIVWRVASLWASSGLIFFAVVLWGSVNDPSVLGKNIPNKTLRTLGGLAIKSAELFGGLDVHAAGGLYLLTIGSGLTTIGAFIPAFRKDVVEHTQPTPPVVIYGLPPGAIYPGPAYGPPVYGPPSYGPPPAPLPPERRQYDDGPWGPPTRYG